MKRFTLALGVVILLFVGVGAQDPNGQDTVYLVMTDNRITPQGGLVQVEFWVVTDNISVNDQIHAFQVPLIWNSSNPAAALKFDSTLSVNRATAEGAFRGSSITNWSLFSFWSDSVMKMVEIGAVTFTGPGLIPGQHLLGTITFSLMDTTTICLDTHSFDYHMFNFVTAQANSYSPVFSEICFPTEFGEQNSAPYFVSLSDSVKFWTGADNQVLVQAVDPDGDPLLILKEITPVPTYSTPVFTDSGNGTAVLKWAPVPADAGYYTVKWTAKDWGFSVDGFTFVRVKALPGNWVAGDLNCDGKVTLSDVIKMVNYIFKGMPISDCLRQ